MEYSNADIQTMLAHKNDIDMQQQRHNNITNGISNFEKLNAEFQKSNWINEKIVFTKQDDPCSEFSIKFIENGKAEIVVPLKNSKYNYKTTMKNHDEAYKYMFNHLKYLQEQE